MLATPAGSHSVFPESVHSLHKLPADADQLGNVRELYESSLNFARPTKEGPSNVPEPTLFDETC